MRTVAVCLCVVLAASLFAVRKYAFPSIETRALTAYSDCLFSDNDVTICARALPIYLEGCDEGHGELCHDAAEVYFAGRVVNNDKSRAARLVERGCELGWGPSCYSLGRARRMGQGCPADAAGALTAYRAACALQQWDACEAAGLLTTRLDDTAARAEALALFGIACKHDNAHACYNYAIARAANDPAYSREVMERFCSVEELQCDVQKLAYHAPWDLPKTWGDRIETLCQPCRPSQEAEKSARD